MARRRLALDFAVALVAATLTALSIRFFGLPQETIWVVDAVAVGFVVGDLMFAAGGRPFWLKHWQDPPPEQPRTPSTPGAAGR